MATRTIPTTTEEKGREKRTRFRVSFYDVLTLLVGLLFAGIALWTRLYTLGLPFDRDGYDEGVYWQSLRSMGSGYHLYQQIFYSQPPFFLLSLYPTYMLFGQTLWSARLGVALLSLLGLVGAFLLGYTLRGRLGGLAALLLLVLDPRYVQQSQTLQAETPFIAFSLLSVATAYLWWKHPDGKRGLVYAALAGATLSFSILCKLFGLATLVPISLLFLAHLYRILRQEQATRLLAARSLLLGVAAFLLVSIALLVPFASSFEQLLQGVISFHTAASSAYASTKSGNFPLMRHALLSLLALAALYGATVALLRRDWLVLPLIAWFGTTALLLWQQVPLFSHHLVALSPPLVALAIMSIDSSPLASLRASKQARALFSTYVTVLAVLLLVLLTFNNAVALQHYYPNQVQQSSALPIAVWDVNVERDVQRVTAPNQLVITDAQFLVGLANRDTDPLLVDTSNVRVSTGYLTPQMLITEASKPSVHTVLFYTGRLLRIKNIALFYSWLKQHFHLIQKYYQGKELWTKI